MSMFEDIPVDVGIIYEGERIRGRDMQVELGGPREEYKFELVQMKSLDEIEDGKVEVIGPDLSELPEGKNTPFGMIIYVAGEEIEKDLEGVIERRVHEYANFIEGFMHLNQRYDVQMRLSKKSYGKGFNSFKFFGEVLMRLYKSEMSFEILKGEKLDDLTGEYEGVNQIIKEKSLGEIERVQLYTAFGYPHTSCGCFEGCAFFIPEMDGYGVVHRNFKGETVNGLNFVTISDLTAGGRQVDGFHGLSIEYMRSPRFMKADGGWDRVVWMPVDIKERIRSYMPPEIVDKIATEEDVSDNDELRAFLQEHDHPIVSRWKAAPKEEPGEITVPTLELPASAIPIQGLPSGMGFTIILKNAKIRAEKMIIKADKR